MTLPGRRYAPPSEGGWATARMSPRHTGGGGGAVVARRLIRCWGQSESGIAEQLADLFESYTNPTVAFLASGGEIKVRLTARAGTPGGGGALADPPGARGGPRR